MESQSGSSPGNTRVLIAFDLAPQLLDRVRQMPSVEIVAVADQAQLTESQLSQAEVVLCWEFGPELFRRAPHLRWIHKMSTGVDRMLYPELVASPVQLTNSSGAHAIPMAEHVIGFMLAVAKDLSGAFRRQSQHVWDKQYTQELYGKTVGIVGMGHVGTEIAKRARVMGMTVLGLRRRAIPNEYVDEMVPPGRLHDLLGRSDFCVVTLPLTAMTRGLFAEAEFRAMRRDACFINVARGSIVQEPALIRALEEGWIGGAALDVAAVEPLPPTSPLWDMKNVIITSHTSGHSVNVNARAVNLFCENLVRYRRGEPLLNVVDRIAGY
ncbi:MAG TPA: D-2-hydroxyacid dehydrogenase [Anaerolineae bacterium]